MLHGCTCKKLLAVLLCAALALPAPGWASDRSRNAARAKEGVGVLLQKVDVNGQVAYLAAAAIPADQEPEAVRLATAQPGSTLVVSGVTDPALAVARESGRLESVDVVVAHEPDQVSFPESFAQSVKDKLKGKIKAISDYCKREKMGLMFAFINSATLTSFAVYNSMEVDKGLAVLAVTFSWVAFLMTSGKAWGRALDSGSNAFRWAAEKAFSIFGKKLSARDKKLYELFGTFTTSWIPNAMAAAVVLWGANSLYLDNFWAAFAQAAWFGLLVNYNIWDAAVLPKVKSGNLSETFWRRYVTLQVLFGTFLEVSSYMGVTQAQNVLVAATVAGVGYLAGQENIESRVVPKAKSLHGMAMRQSEKCENALLGISQTFSRRPAARKTNPFPPDDVQ